MSKRKYEITPNGEWFKVEAWDDYGKYCSVYEKTILDASKFILDWWEKSKENKKSDELLAKAILECKEIDKNNNNLRKIL
tara:strand:+ start:72 stop:311 length:240 start_codon:yes stop_codon:yes gene_type:complete